MDPGHQEAQIVNVMPRRATSLGIAVLLAAATNAAVRAQASREYDIKAAFLYNFVKFVDWPADALPESSLAITLCVLGQNPFGSALDAIKDNVVKGKKIAIRDVADVQDARSCNVLFVSSSEAKRMPQILTELGSASTLTVGDAEGFAERGGMIQLINDQNKVRFQINVDAAERARLKIGSRLLNLARLVRSTARTSL
jgi:hypothetical protein